MNTLLQSRWLPILLLVVSTRIPKLVMGSAPASGGANRALAVRRAARNVPSVRIIRRLRVRREGAPNCSRGGCAPIPISELGFNSFTHSPCSENRAGGRRLQGGQTPHPAHVHERRDGHGQEQPGRCVDFAVSIPALPILTAWEQYVQVLLLVNEFAFIDCSRHPGPRLRKAPA